MIRMLVGYARLGWGFARSLWQRERAEKREQEGEQ